MLNKDELLETLKNMKITKLRMSLMLGISRPTLDLYIDAIFDESKNVPKQEYKKMLFDILLPIIEGKDVSEEELTNKLREAGRKERLSRRDELLSFDRDLRKVRNGLRRMESSSNFSELDLQRTISALDVLSNIENKQSDKFIISSFISYVYGYKNIDENEQTNEQLYLMAGI